MNYSDKEMDLESLFSEIPLNSKTRFKKFADLFNITSQLDKNVREAYLETISNNDDYFFGNIFTGAGKMALGLSMRTLLDLKAAIALYQNKDEQAVEVSVRMLRITIDESIFHSGQVNSF